MSVEKTELVFVETRGELVDTISDLKEHNIIGVDLEAHTYRSYLGTSSYHSVLYTFSFSNNNV